MFHTPRQLIALAMLHASSVLFLPAQSNQTQPPAVPAAPTTRQTCTVTGRVFSAATGQYLNNARLGVRGAGIVAMTDDTGTYILPRVPPGEIVLEVSYTGMQTKHVPLTITDPLTTAQDIEFTAADRLAADGADPEIVELEKYTVTSRTMDGAAIAINEQRFAPNIVSVVSVDEYGVVPEGNVGEFLKMLPGVTMNYRQGDPREISLNGASSSHVPVSIGGFSLASSEMSGTGRNVELNAVSVNTLSRVEVVFSPTPETPGAALAGSVNLVPRSAFERRRPELRFTTYMAWHDNTPQLYKTSGPRRESTFKARPGFEFSWVVPVNKKFGFTVSAGATWRYKESPFATTSWRGTSDATNPANNFPDTTPGNPYLTNYTIRATMAENIRTSFGASADWRITRGSILSFNFTFGTFNSNNTQRSMNFIVASVPDGNFDSTHTHGTGRVDVVTDTNHRYTQTFMPTLRYRYKGSVWSVDSGIGYSDAQHLYRNYDKGMMQSATARRGQLNVKFDDIGYLRPGSITLTDTATGAPVDPFDINNYVMIITAANQPSINNSIITAFANAERVFNWRWPLSLKAGLDYKDQKKNMRVLNRTWNYVGADGAGSTRPTPAGDDSAVPFNDPNYTQRVDMFGFPTVLSLDTVTVFDHMQDSPDYFRQNTDDNYRTTTSNSKLSRESVGSAYVRLDGQFINRRLKLTGGVRIERTDAEGWGALSDPSRNYARDGEGNVIYDSNGVAVPLYTNASDILRATYIARGAHSTANYTNWFPSINASYILATNLIVRGAYYKTVGRPNFDQYSGGITLPDTDVGAGETRYIVLNNAAIKPWNASSYKIALEYYFKKVGLVSVSAFKRDYTDFFATSEFLVTPAILAMYGLDPALYENFMVRTQENLDDPVYTYGLELNYKQELSFLPHWARGVQVFANWSWLRISGAQANANFGSFIPRSGNFGVSLTRSKYNVRLNCNYTGRAKQALVTGNGIAEGTYRYRCERLYVSVQGEYTLSKWLALYCSVNNINNEVEDVEIAGPGTPEHARFQQRTAFRALWTVGFKGKF
ncbi:MAG: TonB-dependent receptor [Opitutaceae bacterium]|nr:TonB-dependent receptor [Opitutaceae bacterium]